MKLLQAIDALDDRIHGARAVPLTDQVRILRPRLCDLIDRLRTAVVEAA